MMLIILWNIFHDAAIIKLVIQYMLTEKPLVKKEIHYSYPTAEELPNISIKNLKFVLFAHEDSHRLP